MATAFAPFRKLRVAAEKSPTEVHNPYLAARREWDERYGDLITRARNCRTMAAFGRSLLYRLAASSGSPVSRA